MLINSSAASSVVSINGRVIDGGSLNVSLDDRGFAYGDGVFETIRCVDGRLPLFSEHIARLEKALNTLRINLPLAQLRRYLDALLILVKERVGKLSAFQSTGVIKIIVTRGEGGRGCYLPNKSQPNVICVFRARELNRARKIELVKSDYPMPDSRGLACLKHLNRLEYICAELSLPKPLQQGQEMLLVDSRGAIIETMHHNLFCWDGKTCKTPLLSSVGVEGVMRQIILSVLTKLNIKLQETTLFPEDLIAGNEVFLTNALQGPEPVLFFEQCLFEDKGLCTTLQKALQQQYSFYEG